MVVGLYGLCAVVNVVCINFLPETSKGEIPDTIEEALQLYDVSLKKNKIFEPKSSELELTDT